MRHRLRPETQELICRAFDAIDALRAGRLTPAQANELAKTLAAEATLLSASRRIGQVDPFRTQRKGKPRSMR